MVDFERTGKTNSAGVTRDLVYSEVAEATFGGVNRGVWI